MADDMKNFIISFFKSLNTEILQQKDILKISNVPESFEKFYGKKSPYLLVFDSIHNTEGTELITKGSFLISMIKDYLENKGQTALLKVDFNINSLEKINENIKLRNCQVSHVSKNINYNSFIRFTFITNLQYLNEKEQIIKDICLDGEKEISFDSEKYKFVEGKKEEIKLGDIKAQYVLAKDILKKNTLPKMNEIGTILDNKLKNEIDRIKAHYLNQKNENEQALKKNQQQIAELERILQNSKDKESILLKIKKFKEIAPLLKSNSNEEKLKKEEEFFINDEIQKHALNINNKLLNTTIIYYPVFDISFYLKKNNSARMTNLIYDFLKEETSKFNCKVCNKEINVLNLCSGGHISCDLCIRKCGDCGEEYCKKCLEKTCFLCGKALCKRCAKRCSVCGKYKCSNHMSTNNLCETCKNKRK